jgi:hypothetical protein
MVMINQIFAAMTVKSQRWSGTNNTLNFTVHSRTAKLLDTDFNLGHQEIADGKGITFRRSIPSGETCDSAAIDAMTWGIRGENLVRIANLVIWGSDGVEFVPLFNFNALDPVTNVATDPIIISADPLEGSMLEMLSPLSLAAPTDPIDKIIAVIEPKSGMRTTNGFVEWETIRAPTEELFGFVVTHSNGLLITSSPLSNSNTLADKETGVWTFSGFPPFQIADAASYALTLIPNGITAPVSGLSDTMIIGFSGEKARCLATSIGGAALRKL